MNLSRYERNDDDCGVDVHEMHSAMG